jgi:hypothetical protein
MWLAFFYYFFIYDGSSGAPKISHSFSPSKNFPHEVKTYKFGIQYYVNDDFIK